MNLQMKLFQLMTGLQSHVMPAAVAGKAHDMMTHPRVRAELRAINDQLMDETISLGNEAHLSIRHGGPIRVVILHGWSGGLAAFEPMIQAFERSRHTVYFVHAPGHGPSNAKVSHPNRFVDALNKALDHIGQPIDLAIGHSMGAGILCYVAGNRPVAHRMALISGPASIESVLQRVADFLNMSARARQAFLNRMVNTTGLALNQLDFAALASNIELPVLVCHDRQDREIPYDAAIQLSQAFQHGRLITSHKQGHQRILKNEDVIAEVRKFIDMPNRVKPAEAHGAADCASKATHCYAS